MLFYAGNRAGCAIRGQRLSPVELAEAILARLEALNPRLQAYLTVDAAGARQTAAAVLQAAVAYEQAAPWAQHRPTVS